MDRARVVLRHVNAAGTVGDACNLQSSLLLFCRVNSKHRPRDRGSNILWIVPARASLPQISGLSMRRMAFLLSQGLWKSLCWKPTEKNLWISAMRPFLLVCNFNALLTPSTVYDGHARCIPDRKEEGDWRKICVKGFSEVLVLDLQGARLHRRSRPV